MSYTHDGRRPVTLRNDPIDPNSTDWFFFSYENWLRTDETITGHSAIVSGGEIETDSVYLGTMVDDDDVSHDEVYGVQVSVTEGATSLTVTHRVTTETSGAVDLGRVDIDHSIVVPVVTL